jgi:uncharacterized protein YdcH (DUF465 family)|tara:strand:- start:152 stop:403 length:252 start_codon:yes stop_codon:yes gene_type:complete
MKLKNSDTPKPTENNEQLLQRFSKRTAQLTARAAELQEAFDEYNRIQKDLARLEGSVQAVEYIAYGKMPGDGNHDKFKDHKPH